MDPRKHKFESARINGFLSFLPSIICLHELMIAFQPFDVFLMLWYLIANYEVYAIWRYSMGPSFIIHFVILLEECKKWDIYDGASTLLSDTLYWATCLGLFMSFTHHQHWVSLLSTFFFFFLWIHASVKVRFSKYLVIKYSFSSMLIVSIFNNKRNGKRKSLFATTAQNIILTHST